MRIALTGGIACGKSLVARCLNKLGVETIDADDIVHELIPAEERKRLAAVVFKDPAARRELESRIHPIVKERIDRFLDERTSRSTDPLSPSSSLASFPPQAPLAPHVSCPTTYPSSRSSLRIAIIPLLFETHWDSEYDIICAVSSTREIQIARMMTMRGYTREEAEARIAAQMPVAEKSAKSNYTIENNGSGTELEKKIEEFVSWLKSLTCSRPR